MFYMNVTALKLLDHLNKFCSGLHTIFAMYIPQLMKTLFTGANGNPQFINAMEVAQQKSKWAKTRHTRQVYAHCGAEIANKIG